MNFHYPINVEPSEHTEGSLLPSESKLFHEKKSIFRIFFVFFIIESPPNSKKTPVKVKKFLFSRLNPNDFMLPASLVPKILDISTRASSNPRSRNECIFMFIALNVVKND